MHIAQLRIKPNKETPATLCDTLCVSPTGGVQGDCNSARDQKISLWNSQDQALAADSHPQGLCMRRFFANVVVDGLDTRAVRPGDVLRLGEVELVVTQAGKRCFADECARQAEGIPDCPLQSCLYATIKNPGALRPGDPVRVF